MSSPSQPSQSSQPSPIYGSHNSCSYGPLLNCCLFPVLPWVENQTLSISEQLENGVRWFDFRLSFYDGDVYLSHTYLMDDTFLNVMKEIDSYFNKNDTAFLMIHIRVDFHDQEHQGYIEPIVGSILRGYARNCFTKETFDATIPLAELSQKARNKILFYNADSTLSNPYIFSSDLMPSLYGWDADSIEAFEERLLGMDTFCEKQTQPFIYKNERMIIFDYSNTFPLYYSDKQQFYMMMKHKNFILQKKPTIIAGNHVEKIIDLMR